MLPSFRPICPRAVSRYGRPSTLNVPSPSPILVRAGLFLDDCVTEVPYLPEEWTIYINPEGQRYFHHKELDMVTEADLYRQDILDKVLSCAFRIRHLAQERMRCTETAELFLELDNHSEGFGYYFIDHTARIVFWMEDVSSDIFLVAGAVSSSHIRLLLEEDYWTHVQYFPMHFGGLDSGLVDDLISVFAYQVIDISTSICPSFPESIDQVKLYLNVLPSIRAPGSSVTDGNIIYIIARLKSRIASAHFYSNYGEQHVRFEQCQSVWLNSANRRHWLTSMCSFLLLNAPMDFTRRLEELYVDQIVHGHLWQTFVSACSSEWENEAKLALGILFSDILLVIAGFGKLAFPSLLLCTATIVIATSLIVRNGQIAHNSTAEHGQMYLQAWTDETFGLCLLGLVMSLPRSFILWAIALLPCEGAILAAQVFNLDAKYTTGIVLMWIGALLVFRPFARRA